MLMFFFERTGEDHVMYIDNKANILNLNRMGYILIILRTLTIN